MARRTGLEPATPGVTGRYSNQLSYHRASAYRLPGVWIYYESGGAASSGVWRACRKTLTWTERGSLAVGKVGGTPQILGYTKGHLPWDIFEQMTREFYANFRGWLQYSVKRVPE